MPHSGRGRYAKTLPLFRRWIGRSSFRSRETIPPGAADRLIGGNPLIDEIKEKYIEGVEVFKEYLQSDAYVEDARAHLDDS